MGGTDLMQERCPCGLIGENCTGLDPRLKTYDEAMTELCLDEGFDSCLIGSGSSRCFCRCGWSGTLCESQDVPLLFNYGTGCSLPSALLNYFFSCWIFFVAACHGFPRDFSSERRSGTREKWYEAQPRIFRLCNIIRTLD